MLKACFRHCNDVNLIGLNLIFKQNVRNVATKWHREYLEQLWMKRQVLGPDRPKPRYEKPNWNYDAEIFAFGARLNEKFNVNTLKQAFLFESFYAKESAQREQVAGNVETSTVEIEHNEKLIEKGEIIIRQYVNGFLRFYFPNLPEEGINAISDHLCSNEQLAAVSSSIGTKDLIYSADFPASSETMAQAFKAVVAGLEKDAGIEKAEKFVQDFVLTHLHDLDVNEIFNLAQPMEVLKAVLKNAGKGEPEPRLIRQSGSFSVTPVFLVGIYVNKELLGYSPGETVKIATEMAARESLKILWKTSSKNQLYDFYRYLNMDQYKNTQNQSLLAICQDDDRLIALRDALEPEPLLAEKMATTWKDEIERTFGVTYRRRLKHAFYKGTPSRQVNASFIKPKVETI